MKDLSIYESGNGGELLMVDGDISLADSLLQVVYLSLFGGNVESTTLGNEKPGDLRNDWWANSLLFPETSKQMNSLTEKALKTVPLSSVGRIQIQNAVDEDLKFLKNIVDIKSEVKIHNVHRVEIYVKLIRYTNKQQVNLQFLWDNIQNSVIFKKEI